MLTQLELFYELVSIYITKVDENERGRKYDRQTSSWYLRDEFVS